jgi:hypothetical protein
MWICLKCKAQNQDSLQLCWICGASPDGKEYPRRYPRFPKPIGMPRQFSIGTLLVLITFFGILCAILKMIGIPPAGYFIIAIYFAVIVAAQTLLFKNNHPRMASIIAGGVLGCLLSVLDFIVEGMKPWQIFEILFFGPFFGCIYGYLTGCMIASIFLVWEGESDEEQCQQSNFIEETEDDN